MPLQYIESDTGTLHFAAVGSGTTTGRVKSLCGSVRGHPRAVTNAWRAHEIIASGARSGGDINPDLCERCRSIASKQHRRPFHSMLEMADEYGAGFR